MITVCVPTKNRSAFLGRLLGYYAATGYRHWIFVGDSSDPEQAERNQALIAALQGRLKVEYRVYPGLSSCECLERLSQAVSTEYAAFVGDDDFLCTSGIERCLEFLERHPDSGAAHGKGLLFQTETDAAHGAIGTVRPYPQVVLNADAGAGRLRELLTASVGGLLYSVHRTQTWRAMFEGIGRLPGTTNTNIFKDELIAVCVSAIRNTVQELDCLYLIRHAHEAIYKHPTIYDWLTDPVWFTSFQVFRDRLVTELRTQDHLHEPDAQAAFKEVFWSYLARALMRGWQRSQRPAQAKPTSRLKVLAKRVPGLRDGWRRVRAIRQRWQEELSLPALLHPSSAYHDDFLAIYRAITMPPADQIPEAAGGAAPPVELATWAGHR